MVHGTLSASPPDRDTPNTIPPTRLPSDGQTIPAPRFPANSRFLTDCYLFSAALSSARRPKRRSWHWPSSPWAAKSEPGGRPGDPQIAEKIQQLNCRRPAPEAANVAVWPALSPCFSSLAGAGMPECPADPPRRGYAQVSAVRADRAPAAQDAWRIQRPALGATRAAAEGVRQVVLSLVAELPAQPAGLVAVPPHPARDDQDQPPPTAAAGTSVVSPGAPPARVLRAGRGSSRLPRFLKLPAGYDPRAAQPPQV